MVHFKYAFLACAVLVSLGQWLPGQSEDVAAGKTPQVQASPELDQAIVASFKATHDGWSSDEVVIRESLNRNFLKTVRLKINQADATDSEDSVSDFAINWRLVALRKAGKLNVKSTRRTRSDSDEFSTVAEMAMRTMQDKHKVSTDRILCDPSLREEFDRLAADVLPKADRYLVRKAALRLRKARQLKPELMGRIADWGRQVTTHSVLQLRENPDRIPEHPGIYIFRDETGYLYIGQAEDLRLRLRQHLDQSHNRSLAKYLSEEHAPAVEVHAFDPDSRAKEVRVRRAYESALISSRKPRFNIQP